MKAWLGKTFGHDRAWLPVALAFLLVNFLTIDDGGTNANARFATLRAMAEQHTFRIDSYKDWTSDWARTPDGHYYSNKAPGPTIAAFPVFWVIDSLLQPWQEKLKDDLGRKQAPRGIHKVAIAGIFQVLPFLFLVLVLLKMVFPSISPMAYLAASAAMLFGNTAAILMNSYMGNPFAAVAMLGLGWAYLRKSLGWMAFFFGLMVLAEYPTAALVIPFFFLAASDFRELGGKKWLGRLVLGAFLPAVIWCWYHTVCFGSPFSLPFHYEVTAALVGTVEQNAATVWGGIASFLPKFEYIFQLLFGPSRGILFTQPWLFVVWIAGFYYLPRNDRLWRLFLFSFSSFFILLWLNAGFPGWHGGGSPGPRYLSAALPIFGIFIPAFYQRLPLWGRGVLWITIILPVVLRGLVFATWILPPPVPIWPYYLGAIQTPKEWLELSVFTLVLGRALIAYFRPSRLR